MSVAPVIQDVNQLWTAIYDESSSRFYYANVETSEVTWDKPQGYIEEEESEDEEDDDEDDDKFDNGNLNDLNDLIDSPPISPPLSPISRSNPVIPSLSSMPPIPIYSKEGLSGISSIKSHTTSRTPEGIEFPMMEYAKDNFNRVHKERFKAPVERTLDEVVVWQGRALKTSVRTLPANLVPAALQAFRNVTGYMGYRQTGKRQDDHCIKLLRNALLRPEEFRDEIYCQICKQVTRNPTENGTIRGWQLFTICLATFCPSIELQAHLVTFVTYYCQPNVGYRNKQVTQYANTCLIALEKNLHQSAREEIPTLEELVTLQDHTKVPMTVTFLDGTYQTVNVDSWTTGKEMERMIAAEKGLQCIEAYAIFEVGTNDQERRLDPEERILDLSSLWMRMRSEMKSKLFRNGSSLVDYSLQFKVFLHVEVDIDQVEDIKMMYIQAVNDVVSGIYTFTLEDMTSLAALQMQHVFGEYDECRVNELVDDASTFLPQATLDEGEKSEIIDKVTSKYAALRPMSKQQTKLEYLDLCNSLKTFGATFFPVENRRNRQMPIDMVLAVNRQGIHLVDPKSSQIMAHYFYHDIESWGYSEIGFLFITKSEENPEFKRFFKTTQGEAINGCVAAYIAYLIEKSSSGIQ